jgi:hypothetical protein
MRNNRCAYRIIVGRTEGRRRLERHKRTREENINMGLQEVGWRGMDWIDLAQDRTGGTLL